MAILGIDLGGTKLAVAVFSGTGQLLSRESVPLSDRKSSAVGELIQSQIRKYSSTLEIQSVGISVPGISRQNSGTVWAPNIEGWEDYPLLREVREVVGEKPVSIDNDRACCILGERWQGNAAGCDDAIFIAVGTGIGAGIISGGHLIRGHNDIAGAIGWMALPKPYEGKYAPCGCFEYYASGAGIPKFARDVLAADPNESILRVHLPDNLNAQHVFEAYDDGDSIARTVIGECIAYWGMATANLVSIFNPEKIIFGGGVFGPAAQHIPAIKTEATKWAQPVSIQQVSFECSKLGGDAAVYGAGYLGLKNCNIHS
jgi:glucokinase